MLLSTCENPIGEHRAQNDMVHHSTLKPTIDHRDASVQSWQCFPEGSLSSIDSLPPIEDDESLHNNDSPARVLTRHESIPRVKLMCSYGGRILPRPLDGKLRYVGGETRIISVNRDVTYAELMQKMTEHYGQDLSLKYQLPNEELDALISVSNDEDLLNMMEEYDRLEACGDGLQRLRVFLFSNVDGEFFLDQLDPRRSEQWYVEAVNGFLETSSRRSDSGYSGSGLSTRPSAENLVALDNVQEFEDPAALLHAKRLQELQHSPAWQLGGVDGEVYYSAPVHEHERFQRVGMPRVPSNGKLSRLQEQFDDGSPELHGHERYSLPPRHQANNQEYRREYNGHTDGVYSHLVPQHQHLPPPPPPPQQQMMYHKDQYHNSREYHHRHQLGEDFILPPQLQHHLQQQQDDYHPGHLYQRAASHLDAGYIGASNPSSPLRHAAPPPFHAHRPPVYSGNAMEQQYVRRPVMRQEAGAVYPTSPPRYREHQDDHRLDDHCNLFHHHGAEHVIFDHKPQAVGVAVYPPTGYQESSFYGGGDMRRPMQQPAVHLDYQDQLMQMEHLSLHAHTQRAQPRLQEGGEGKDVEQYWPAQQQHFEGMNHYAKQPVVLNENNVPNKGKDMDIDWFIGDDADGLSGSEQQLVFDTGSVSTRMDAKLSAITSSCLAGLAQSQAPPLVELVDLPVYDKSVQSMPSGGSVAEGCAAVVPVLDLLSDVPTAATPQSKVMSEIGQLAEEMASSVLRSGVRRQKQKSTMQSQVYASDPENNIKQPQTQTPELVSEPTFTVQNWENALIHAGDDDGNKGEDVTTRCDEEDDNCEDKTCNEEERTEESADKSQDITLLAEQEAIFRGLQTIRNADLEEIRELGSGTYGTVYHGKWRGTDVAIKRIKASCFEGKQSDRERLIADFWKEACTLSQLHHPNVVAFYGVVPDGPGGTLATVTEYMVNGSLKQVLQKKDRTIDRRKRLLIALDAAFGMEYLHGKNIVHFDLKGENLLVNMRDPHRPVCKVGDLGLSKVKRQTMVSGGVRGTLPWMAPELLSTTSCKVTEKVDVYSFGIVMWELLTGEEPYADKHYGEIIGGIVSNTLRPSIPHWCDPAWRSLMERCWSADASTRPSFSEIASELRAMSSSPPSKA